MTETRFIPSLVGIKYPRIEDPVKLECNIVSGDGTLARNFHCGFLEALDIRNTIEKWDQYCKTRFKDAVELSHSFDNPCCLLWDETNYGVSRKRGALKVGGGGRRVSAGAAEERCTGSGLKWSDIKMSSGDDALREFVGGRGWRREDSM